MTFIPPLRASQSGHGLRQRSTLMPRRANTHPGGTRPKATSTPPSLTIRTSQASSEPSDTVSSRTAVPSSTHRQHRWSELVPPQTALTFVAMYDPADGLLTFSGAELLPSEPPTPPAPHTPSLSPGTPGTPTTIAFGPMPCTPAPSTLADMQSLLDAYFRSAATTGAGNNHVMPARASSTFDGLRCGSILPNESGSTKAGTGAGVGGGREKPLPVRPPPPPDRDSVSAWSCLGRKATDDPREPCDASGNDCHGGGCSGCACWPSAADSGYVSEGCDGASCDGGDNGDGDSFYFTPPELEDPNECSAFSVTTTSTSEYIDVPGRECDSIWSANVLAYAYPARGQARAQTQPSSPTSPAQALLHPWRLLRARASQTSIAGPPQRRASRAASMFAKLGRLGSRDDGESWICVEVVHTVTQRPLRECDW